MSGKKGLLAMILAGALCALIFTYGSKRKKAAMSDDDAAALTEAVEEAPVAVEA